MTATPSSLRYPRSWIRRRLQGAFVSRTTSENLKSLPGRMFNTHLLGPMFGREDLYGVRGFRAHGLSCLLVGFATQCADGIYDEPAGR